MRDEVSRVLRGVRIRIFPTKEQETLFYRYAGISRWVYNKYLEERNKSYIDWIERGKTGDKPITRFDFSKKLTYLKNEVPEYSWLNDAPRHTLNQALIDCDSAMQRHMKGIGGKPRFKSRKHSKVSFYTEPCSIKRNRNGFRAERLGVIKTKKPLPKLSKNEKYHNPRISFDGKHWFITFTVYRECKPIRYNGGSLGVDVGIKSLAVTSDGTYYENVNKMNHRLKKLNCKKRRLQRRLSHKNESHVTGYTKGKRGGRVPKYDKPLDDCKNIQKDKKLLSEVQRKIDNIRLNYLHHISREIVSRPKTRYIVMEDLNVQGMMKNRHLSKSIQEANLYELQRQITYKSEEEGITVIKADRFYPSSKICSRCGCVKKDLKLSDRIYHCPECGLEIDRDLNAAINLAKLVPEAYREITSGEESHQTLVDCFSSNEDSSEPERRDREVRQVSVGGNRHD